jgi:predicted GNAT superfamily acetyltransferase
MTVAGVEIRTLTSPTGMADVASVFQRVWGTDHPIVNAELLRAVAHAGGYVAAACRSGEMVGASFAFPARHRGVAALHSHVTGVVPGIQHRGIGRLLKQHQRAWAAEHGFEWITWTFDPLVRRNAWFNIAVLGASVTDYLVDFYGPMTDAINARDETDRVHVAWPTDPHPARPPAPPANAPAVATPDDIVDLRRTDPDAAARWRLRVRDELGGAIGRGGAVVGFNRAGEYLIHVPT